MLPLALYPHSRLFPPPTAVRFLSHEIFRRLASLDGRWFTLTASLWLTAQISTAPRSPANPIPSARSSSLCSTLPLTLLALILLGCPGLCDSGLPSPHCHPHLHESHHRHPPPHSPTLSHTHTLCLMFPSPACPILFLSTALILLFQHL